MRVKVNLENILQYGLDTITGNSRADLLAAATRADELGEELFVQIPDVEGGDTEAPTERNAFEHYGSDLPEPDGEAHEQESVDLTKPIERWEKISCNPDCAVRTVEGHTHWLDHDTDERWAFPPGNSPLELRED